MVVCVVPIAIFAFCNASASESASRQSWQRLYDDNNNWWHCFPIAMYSSPKEKSVLVFRLSPWTHTQHDERIGRYARMEKKILYLWNMSNEVAEWKMHRVLLHLKTAIIWDDARERSQTRLHSHFRQQQQRRQLRLKIEHRASAFRDYWRRVQWQQQQSVRKTLNANRKNGRIYGA